ncbi:MAG: hypothetical protein PHX61_02625 [Alphaproteobacteria bacterium]|nr:hypothetical protein [Alphaproteobacteria bacterium]
MTEKLCDRGCGTMIHFEKELGKFVAKNPDGSLHKCKDGKLIPTAVPPSSIPRKIARLDNYGQGSATFTLRGGKKQVYALTPDRYEEFRKGALLMPAENHPDAWLDFAVDRQSFVMPGWKVVQAPEWAKELSDPTGEEVKIFKSGKEILRENLEKKRAEAAQQETSTEAPGAGIPSIPSQEPKTPAGTAPAAPQEDPEQMIQRAIAAMMPSDRVGYRISLAGMVNSAIEMKKMSTDAPKTYAELEAEVKRDAVRLFLWCDSLTTHNLER